MRRCTVEGCDRKHYAKGWCANHYGKAQRRSNGDPTTLHPRYEVLLCAVEGCKRRARCRGWCSTHYSRWRKHGDPTALLHAQAYGMGHLKHGYRWLYRPSHPGASKNGLIAEHRYVMSQKLGRPLLPDEVVHHKNGDRSDNSIENLELWVRSHPSGQRVQEVLAWAEEMVARYRTA